VQGEVPPGAALARTGRMSLGPVPQGFDLSRIVMSHGWCQLAPTAYDDDRRVLHRTLDLPDAGPLTVSVHERSGRLEASWGRVKGTCDDRIAVKAQLRRMLAMDDDLTELYEHCRTVPTLAWVPASGLGRMLRSPTVFEDLAKTLATTNCSWSLTKLMCARLVASLGNEGPEGERAFPSPNAVESAGEKHFTDVVRAGYRARAFVELAAAYDTLGTERWTDPAVDDATVLKEILALRGFGPYAAEGMLGLLGRPRGLAIDSWVRAKLPGLLGRDAMTDAEIAEHFAPLGRWAGAGLWLELTRDWFEL
jgi:N-glycosylase/DNA lyase